MIGELNERFFAVKFSSQTVKMDWHGKNLLSLVDPGIATISIVSALPFQYVGRLLFMDRQHSGHPFFHGSGGSGGGPSCP